jgi:hypothetical protein
MADSAEEIRAKLLADIRESDELHDNVDVAAQQAAAYAKSIAPVGATKDPHPGRFRDSIHSVVAPNDKYGLPRGRVVSDDPAASFIEFGTQYTAEHATFAQTAAHFQGSGTDFGKVQDPRR